MGVSQPVAWRYSHRSRSTPMILLALVLIRAAQADTSQVGRDDPRLIVVEATRAVERDSASPLAAVWKEQLRRDSTDRPAALGLATLARLTYDYPTAERLYRLLYTADSSHPDRYAV